MLHIRNIQHQATFGYGLKEMDVDGQTYRFNKPTDSVIHDRINGNWKTEETDDRPVQLTGAK